MLYRGARVIAGAPMAFDEMVRVRFLYEYARPSPMPFYTIALCHPSDRTAQLLYVAIKTLYKGLVCPVAAQREDAQGQEQGGKTCQRQKVMRDIQQA